MSNCQVCQSPAGAVDWCEECYASLCPDCVESHKCSSGSLPSMCISCKAKDSEIAQLKAEIERLKEYEYMYEDLCE